MEGGRRCAWAVLWVLKREESSDCGVRPSRVAWSVCLALLLSPATAPHPFAIAPRPYGSESERTRMDQIRDSDSHLCTFFWVELPRTNPMIPIRRLFLFP